MLLLARAAAVSPAAIFSPSYGALPVGFSLLDSPLTLFSKYSPITAPYPGHGTLTHALIIKGWKTQRVKCEKGKKCGNRKDPGTGENAVKGGNVGNEEMRESETVWEKIGNVGKEEMRQREETWGRRICGKGEHVEKKEIRVKGRNARK